MMVKIGCNHIKTKTKPRESVAESACAKHHEPPIPPNKIMPIMAFMFLIFCMCLFLNNQRKPRRSIPAIVVSRAMRRFPQIGVH